MPPYRRRPAFSFAGTPTFHRPPRIRSSSAVAPTNSQAGSSRFSNNEVENGDEEEDDSTDDDSEDIIMAIDQQGRKIGCALYTVADQKLSLMEDIEFPSSDCVDAHEFSTPYHVSVRPGAEFSYDSAKIKLISLRIEEDSGPSLIIQTPGDLHDISGEQRRRGNLLKLASWVNIESRVTVGCAGAVLTYLQRKRAVEEPGSGVDTDGMKISSLEMWSMRDVMFVNADTICSLQIFEDEAHPNFHMQGPQGRGKEGLSVFGIMNVTRSPLGHTMLKQWFLRPSLSIDIITQRQDSIAVFLTPDNTHTLETVGKSLRKVKKIPKILGGLRRGKGSAGRGGEWNALLQFAFHTLKIRTCFQEIIGGRGLEIYKKVMEVFDVSRLQAVGQMINDTIDFEESALQHRVVIKGNIDAELDQMKHMYDGMDSMLSEVARQIAASIPEDVATRLNVIYFPQLGYLTAVPSIEGSENGGDSEDGGPRPSYAGEGWEFQFCTGTSWYYKNPQMREMDEYFGDMYGLICDREIELVHQLQVKVLEHDKMLVACAMTCAEIDWQVY
ncbi:hypothetical protein RUND412_009935 [Rhizina undulata]